MKAKEMHQLNNEQLQQELNNLLREAFNLRMQKGTGQLTKKSEMQRVRRDIARIKTIVHAKKAAGE